MENTPFKNIRPFSAVITAAIILTAGFSIAGAAVSQSEAKLFQQAYENYQARNYSKTHAALNKLIALYPQTEYLEKATLWHAECFIRLNKYEQTRKTASVFLNRYPNSEYRAHAMQLNGIALFRSGSQFQGMVQLLKALELSRSPVLDSIIIRSADVYIQKKAQPEELLELENIFSANARISATVHYARGIKLFEARNFPEAGDVFESFITQFPYDSRVEKAKQYAKEANDRNDFAFRVMLLLPLREDYMQAALSVQHSVDIAFRDYNASHKKKIYWKTLNTQGNTLNCIHEIESLSQNGKVNAVIGPLLSEEVIAAGLAMKNYPVPVLTPTATGDNITATCSTLYQVPVPPTAIAKKLAEYSVNVLKITDFTVIAPLTVYGKVMAQGFINALKPLNATCSIEEYYSEGETNFKDIFQRIRDKRFREDYFRKLLDSGIVSLNDTLNQPSAVDDTTTVFTGGIFIPCNTEEVIALASQADHYRIKGQLLGTSDWYSKEIAQQGRKSVEGAILCVDFLPEATPQLWSQFSTAYQKQYAAVPDRIAGQAYDTARLLCMALDSLKDNSPPTELNSILSKTVNYQGVCGKISFNPQTRSNEEGFIFRIRQGNFVRVQ